MNADGISNGTYDLCLWNWILIPTYVSALQYATLRCSFICDAMQRCGARCSHHCWYELLKRWKICSMRWCDEHLIFFQWTNALHTCVYSASNNIVNSICFLIGAARKKANGAYNLQRQQQRFPFYVYGCLKDCRCWIFIYVYSLQLFIYLSSARRHLAAGE